MKKVTAADIIRWSRLSKRRAERNVRSRRRHAELRRIGKTYQTAERPVSRAMKQVLVKAPAKLTLLGQTYEDTIRFFEEARKVALVDGHKAVLDLRAVTALRPDVTLLLVAEIQRIKFLKGGDAISGVSPDDDVARASLHGMGVFDALGMYDPVSLEKGDDLDAVFSIQTDTTLNGELTKTLADDFAAALNLDDARKSKIQKALNEALENISEHAYYDRDRMQWPAEPSRWWISTMASSEKQGAFMLACDLGMTIPETIAETASKRGPTNAAAFAAYIAKNFAKSDAERHLGAAFEAGVTRRVEGKGGNGLVKMADLVHEFPGGYLAVLSGGAVAMIKSGEQGVLLKKLPIPFAGTYVLWHLGNLTGIEND